MNILKRLISSYAVSALMYLSSSNILTAANKNSTGDKKRTDSSMEEFTSELEAITLASSAVSLLIDSFVNQKLLLTNTSLQYLCTAVESVVTASVLSRYFGKETGTIGTNLIDVLKKLSINEFSLTNVGVLSLVALRALTLKFINDQNMYIDELSDIKGITEKNNYVIGGEEIDKMLQPFNSMGQ
jgi:hypothetical protein